MICNSKQDRLREDCYFYWSYFECLCSGLIARRTQKVTSKYTQPRRDPSCGLSVAGLLNKMHTLAKIFTAASAGVVPLLSKWAARLNNNWKFLDVTKWHITWQNPTVTHSFDLEHRCTSKEWIPVSCLTAQHAQTWTFVDRQVCK